MSKDKPVELTDEQISEWVKLVKSQNAVRRWSVQGLSPQEINKRKDALDNYPNMAMQTEKGQAEMLAALEKVFYDCDSENMGSLSAQDFWPWQLAYCAWHDTLPGVMGHWIMPKSEWDKFTDWYLKNVMIVDGRTTYDQFVVSFTAYNEKVLPMTKVKPVELTDEQSAKWLKIMMSQNAVRKWSVKGLSNKEAKKRQKALLDYPTMMFGTEEGTAKMMADMENVFYQSDSQNMGSITGQDFWTLWENMGAYHDTLPGIKGHWVWDHKTWDGEIDWYFDTFGSGGRMTCEQWFATFPVYMQKI